MSERVDSRENKERNINPRTTSSDLFFSSIPARLELQKHSWGVQQSSFHRSPFAHVLTLWCLPVLLYQSQLTVYQSRCLPACGSLEPSDLTHLSVTHTHLAGCDYVSVLALSHPSKTPLYHYLPLVRSLSYLKGRNSTPAEWTSLYLQKDNIWKQKKKRLWSFKIITQQGSVWVSQLIKSFGSSEDMKRISYT